MTSADPPGEGNKKQDGETREPPEVGLISDEELPEDLQPSENPLAKDPAEEGQDDGADDGGPGKAEQVPDMGGPGAPG